MRITVWDSWFLGWHYYITCGWCSTLSKLWEQHLSFIGFSGYWKSLHMGEGPIAYNHTFSWDHVLMTWCTHHIRKPLGSWLRQLGKLSPLNSMVKDHDQENVGPWSPQNTSKGCPMQIHKSFMCESRLWNIM
jgi:hypothetical protein